MPCNSGGDDHSYASADASEARRGVERHQHILDDHADSLCILRELVLSLVRRRADLTPDELMLANRLIASVEKHREFDQQQGRRA